MLLPIYLSNNNISYKLSEYLSNFNKNKDRIQLWQCFGTKISTFVTMHLKNKNNKEILSGLLKEFEKLNLPKNNIHYNSYINLKSEILYIIRKQFFNSCKALNSINNSSIYEIPISNLSYINGDCVNAMGLNNEFSNSLEFAIDFKSKQMEEKNYN